jgi:hypothetical protein
MNLSEVVPSVLHPIILSGAECHNHHRNLLSSGLRVSFRIVLGWLVRMALSLIPHGDLWLF